jgi:DNA replication and repair protein RecF
VRLLTLRIRGFRNLADASLAIPREGMVLVGANGHGKTNLLEAVSYPVLLRSFRGAPDGDLVTHAQGRFDLEATLAGARAEQVSVQYTARGRQKRVEVDGAEERTLTAAMGRWLAVVFLPGDVGLAGGPASERRRYLDRMLSLSDPAYLRALLRYRAALAQRNAALRQRHPEMAQAFERILAEHGALLVRHRLHWVDTVGAAFAEEAATLGERASIELRYAGRPALAEPGEWPAAFAASESTDRVRGSTSVGPHRDDVELSLEGRSLRVYGSTGQLRSAAVAFKLLELETLRRAHGTEPALVLDDVFAELDDTRQERLALRLAGSGRQLFITAPRRSELPGALDLPCWRMEAGHAEPDGSG